MLTLFSPAMLREPFRWAQDLRARGLETLLVYVTQQVRQFQTRGERFAMTHWGAEEMQRVKRELIQEECKTMSPEELRVFLGLDDWLKNMPAEERLKGLAAEERLKGLPAEERLKGLAPEALLAALAPGGPRTSACPPPTGPEDRERRVESPPFVPTSFAEPVTPPSA